MQIKFVTANAVVPERSALALIVFDGEPLTGVAAEFDERMSGGLSLALSASRFTGAKGKVLDLLGPSGVEQARILLVGAGKRSDFDDVAAEHAAASAYNAVKTSGLEVLRLQFADDAAEKAARAALGVRLAAYRFDRYRTKRLPEENVSITKAEVVAANPYKALEGFAPYAALADAIAFSRDLVWEPANILYPVEFANRVKALEELGLEVEVFGESQMAELGMGSLLGVGKGSIRESQLVVIRWNGAADKNAQPMAFVGKGVCFDSGGISLKSANGMEDMKWDMGGAAAVAGVMHVLAGRKAKINAVGVLGLVENMPDGGAQRPGDIVTSMSGQTIEIINTDAEGRLVLADALWYCQDRFQPKFMVDLATLTGAIATSLGNDYAGLFSNDDELSANLLAASSAEDEPLWRMPLPPRYEREIESAAADMKNMGGRGPGAITAALFLQKFVNGMPWAHLDIASTAWKKASSVPTAPDGATGYGVRLLNRMVADKYED